MQSRVNFFYWNPVIQTADTDTSSIATVKTAVYSIHNSRQSFYYYTRLMKWTKTFQNVHIKSEHYIRSIDGRHSIYVTTKHFKCIFITGSKWWIPYVEEFSQQIWYFIYQKSYFPFYFILCILSHEMCIKTKSYVYEDWDHIAIQRDDFFSC